jgi:hypothetical protein
MLAMLALTFTPPALAAPATLACAGNAHLNWRATAPVLVETGDAADDLDRGPIVHLSPSSGEWYLEQPGSAALTVGGGTFEVRRPSDFTAHYEEWVGIDHDTVLRISGGGPAPLRFVFISRDYSLIMGECIEPAETFIFLTEPQL